MRRLGRALFVLCLVVSALAVPVTTQAAASPPTRLAGDSRLTTAIAISRAAFPDGATTVYLARADVFADALAAGALTDGPVLLVPSCGRLPDPVRQEIDRLTPARVVALGGTSAVCDVLLEQAADGRVGDRISGSSRFETAVAISRGAFPEGAPRVYVARATDSPDAVAAGTMTEGPVLLVPAAGAVPAVVAEEVRRLGVSRVTALGGQSAVSDDVLAQAAKTLPVDRLAGPDRLATAVAISASQFEAPRHDGFVAVRADRAYLARADVFADAVAAGVLTDGPILLVPSCGQLPDTVRGELLRLGAPPVVGLGGRAAVCDELLDQAAGLTADTLKPQPVEVADEAVVLDAEDRAALIDATEYTVTFTGDHPPVEPGDVLVSAPTDAAPEGLLRRVTGSTQSGSRTELRTEHAELVDVLESGSAAFSKVLSVEDVQRMEPLAAGVNPVQSDDRMQSQAASTEHRIVLRDLVLYDEDGDTSTRLDQIRLNGSVAASLVLDGVVDVRRKGLRPVLEQFALTAEIAQTSDLQLTSGVAFKADVRREIARYHFTPITFQIGPVPVVLVPDLVLSVGVDGGLEGSVSLGVNQRASYKAGASYRDGQGWRRIAEPATDVDWVPPTFDASAHARAFGRAEVSTRLYGVAGPTIAADLYGRIEAAALPWPSWRTFAGARATFAVKAGLPLVGDVLRYEATIFSVERPLGRSGFSEEQVKEIIGCDGYCVLTGTVPLRHPAWGEVILTTTITGTDPPASFGAFGEAEIAVVDDKGRIRYRADLEHWGAPIYLLQPINTGAHEAPNLPSTSARDLTGHVFLDYNPGRYNGVIVLKPTLDGFEDFGSLGDATFYYAEVLDVEGDGIHELRQQGNDCDPSCAEGHTGSDLLRWTGRDYSLQPRTAPLHLGPNGIGTTPFNVQLGSLALVQRISQRLGPPTSDLGWTNSDCNSRRYFSRQYSWGALTVWFGSDGDGDDVILEGWQLDRPGMAASTMAARGMAIEYGIDDTTAWPLLERLGATVFGPHHYWNIHVDHLNGMLTGPPGPSTTIRRIAAGIGSSPCESMAH